MVNRRNTREETNGRGVVGWECVPPLIPSGCWSTTNRQIAMYPMSHLHLSRNIASFVLLAMHSNPFLGNSFSLHKVMSKQSKELLFRWCNCPPPTPYQNCAPSPPPLYPIQRTVDKEIELLPLFAFINGWKYLFLVLMHSSVNEWWDENSSTQYQIMFQCQGALIWPRMYPGNRRSSCTREGGVGLIMEQYNGCWNDRDSNNVVKNYAV